MYLNFAEPAVLTSRSRFSKQEPLRVGCRIGWVHQRSGFLWWLVRHRPKLRRCEVPKFRRP